MTASHVLPQIQRLDPRSDHQQILFLSLCHDFPLDAAIIAILLLLRSFSVPRVSALLDATGQFYSQGRHRSLRLAAAMGELVHFGYDSDRGRAVVARMNKAHGRYDTTNDDFLYLLSRFMLDPIAWIDRFGWRPLCEQERLAIFFFWREVGCRMHIQGIPATPTDLARFSQDFEREHCRPAETNHRLFVALREALTGWLPSPFRPLFRRVFPCLMDESLRRHLMVANPPRVLETTIRATLRLRARAANWLPARRQPYFSLARLSGWGGLVVSPASQPT